MGADFSPSLANIFTSLIVCEFIHTHTVTPLIFIHHLDDSFILWPGDDFKHFKSDLNSFHPSYLHFQSMHSIRV